MEFLEKKMKKSHVPFILMLALWPLQVFADASPPAPHIDSGNTAWLLVSAALVMLMTPGLAFFYAGMVNKKNVVPRFFKTTLPLRSWDSCGW